MDQRELDPGARCQSQSKMGPLSRGKKGPFRVMFVWRFGARARHIASPCQSACWPLGHHCSDLDGALITFVCYGCV
jgi:hypothetical protein